MGHAIKHYQKLYGIEDSFLARFKERNAETAEKGFRPFKGAAEICRAVKECGGENYLLTHRGESSAYFIAKFGLASCFAELVTSKNAFERKPSPQGILHLIKQHDFPMREALMIGDRDIDILAAKSAGINSCFFSHEGGHCPQATMNVSSFEELLSALNE
ncbi:MAG: HAD hydrolase-like protein [Christensenellales bacterium]|jgi:phosphoglycolate phosphatase-like HAD superfamily hydrolase